MEKTLVQILDEKQKKAEQGPWLPACCGTEVPFFQAYPVHTLHQSDRRTERLNNMSTSSARVQGKWQIRGIRPDGKKFAFSVLAYDHAEASKLAKHTKSGYVTDVVLLDGDKEKIRARAAQAAN